MKTPTTFLEERKYQVIYADPPWNYSAGAKKNGFSSSAYPPMKTEAICALNIAGIIDENAHLYLWTTNFFLPDAIRVLESWGFRYVTMLTWYKGNGGMGRYFQTNTEHVLFGVKGSLKTKTLKSNYFDFKNPRKHSKKPDEFRDMIVERSGNLPRIELFARTKTNGWDVWGNEVKSDITLPPHSQYEM